MSGPTRWFHRSLMARRYRGGASVRVGRYYLADGGMLDWIYVNGDAHYEERR